METPTHLLSTPTTSRTGYQTFSSEEPTSSQATAQTVGRRILTRILSCCPDLVVPFKRISRNISIMHRRIQYERSRRQALTPIDNDAIEIARKAFSEFIDSTLIKVAKEGGHDVKKELKNYLSKRSPGLQKDKSTIFKIQVICAYAQELQERPETEELLDVLRLRYAALAFELQDTLINIHDNIDDSGILPCEKINDFQTLLESSLKYFIVNNPETGQTERFNDCLEVHFPASFIGHLERNIANNNYYLVDEQHPEKQVSLSSSQTHEERKEAIPLFASL